MDTRTVTCKGGPLHNKRYTVPVDTDTFPAPGGTYRATAKQATWRPGKPTTDADLGDALEALAADTHGQADQ